MRKTTKSLFLAGAAALLAFGMASAQAQTPYVSATVSGQLQPGVYGRIDIGNAPPPPLLYAQPLIIQRPAVYVQQAPLYLHVPPGHAKKWSKHCSRYNACGQPVYFVKVRGDDEYERRSYQRSFSEQRVYERDDDHGKHKNKGHGNGKNKNKHDD